MPLTCLFNRMIDWLNIMNDIHAYLRNGTYTGYVCQASTVWNDQAPVCWSSHLSQRPNKLLNNRCIQTALHTLAECAECALPTNAFTRVVLLMALDFFRHEIMHTPSQKFPFNCCCWAIVCSAERWIRVIMCAFSYARMSIGWFRPILKPKSKKQEANAFERIFFFLYTHFSFQFHKIWLLEKSRITRTVTIVILWQTKGRCLTVHCYFIKGISEVYFYCGLKSQY